MDQNLKETYDAFVAAPGKTRIAVKWTASIIVGYCASSVVRTALRNVQFPENKTDKVKLSIGSYAVGAAAAQRAKRVIERDVDDAFDTVAKFRKKWQETPPLSPKTEPEIVTPTE